MSLDQLQFDREKWQDEREIRKREVAVREAELELKRSEFRRSRLLSPLFIAVVAAGLAAAGNAGVAYINGTQQRDLEGARATTQNALETNRSVATNNLEREKSAALAIIEEAKAESARILEMIKTGDREVAAQNLQFLLDAGLIVNVDRRKLIAEYLKNRRVGEGPVLDAAGTAPVPSGYRQKYKVFVQFAGTIQRPDVKSMMLALEGKGWAMQGTDGGGERIASAAGKNLVKHGIGGAEAAQLLAAEMQDLTPAGKSVTLMEDPQIRAGQLEIWISN